ncbi:hypothetical protein SAMD00023353_4800670 [Rosellinia necatrix]|uniref:Uncharacterized protein n=1 Tax=Rosellinia necatrix TaxID=77044 RepID=A0A1S8A9H2_ROSNE|nr:hypothetical protein SAMD00023353_4800670 [Rosellinia necatrix]
MPKNQRVKKPAVRPRRFQDEAGAINTVKEAARVPAPSKLGANAFARLDKRSLHSPSPNGSLWKRSAAEAGNRA